MESVKSRILTRKLGYLRHLLSNGDGGVVASSGDGGVVASAMHALLDDPGSICVVRDCRELEAVYDLKFTDAHSQQCEFYATTSNQKQIYEADKSLLLHPCRYYEITPYC